MRRPCGAVRGQPRATHWCVLIGTPSHSNYYSGTGKQVKHRPRFEGGGAVEHTVRPYTSHKLWKLRIDYNQVGMNHTAMQDLNNMVKTVLDYSVLYLIKCITLECPPLRCFHLNVHTSSFAQV